MININLIKAPNQSLSFNEGSNLWEIRIVTANQVMAADILLNGDPVVLGQRIVAQAPIIPYPHLSEQGNFAILTQGEELPWWEGFETDQQLVFIFPEELFRPQVLKPLRPKLLENQVLISPSFVNWWADSINQACTLGFRHGEL